MAGLSLSDNCLNSRGLQAGVDSLNVAAPCAECFPLVTSAMRPTSQLTPHSSHLTPCHSLATRVFLCFFSQVACYRLHVSCHKLPRTTLPRATHCSSTHHSSIITCHASHSAHHTSCLKSLLALVLCLMMRTRGCHVTFAAGAILMHTLTS